MHNLLYTLQKNKHKGGDQHHIKNYFLKILLWVADKYKLLLSMW